MWHHHFPTEPHPLQTGEDGTDKNTHTNISYVGQKKKKTVLTLAENLLFMQKTISHVDCKNRSSGPFDGHVRCIHVILVCYPRCKKRTIIQFEVIYLNSRSYNFILLLQSVSFISQTDGASSACEAVSPCCRRYAVKMSNQLRNVNANVLFTEVMKFFFPVVKRQ